MQIHNVRSMHSKTEMHTEIWLGNPKKKGVTADEGQQTFDNDDY